MVDFDTEWELIILLLVMECTIVQKKARALFSKSNKEGGSN